jgi:hypothetical protein
LGILLKNGSSHSQNEWISKRTSKAKKFAKTGVDKVWTKPKRFATHWFTIKNMRKSMGLLY